MKTSAEFTKNLKEGIITDEMLEAALYSVNKRAKNWRNRKREYRYVRYDKYHNYEKAEENEKLMYKKKGNYVVRSEAVLYPQRIGRI